jgi:hypothetical protein
LCEGGGAALPLGFPFLEASRVFSRDNFLAVLKVAELLIAKLPGPALDGVDGCALLEVMVMLTDRELLKLYFVPLTEKSKDLGVHFQCLPIHREAHDPQM